MKRILLILSLLGYASVMRAQLPDPVQAVPVQLQLLQYHVYAWCKGTPPPPDYYQQIQETPFPHMQVLIHRLDSPSVSMTPSADSSGFVRVDLPPGLYCAKILTIEVPQVDPNVDDLYALMRGETPPPDCDLQFSVAEKDNPIFLVIKGFLHPCTQKFPNQPDPMQGQ